MAINACDICDCIPQNVGEGFFNQAALNLLCGIITAIEGGGGIADNVNIASYGGTATTLGQKAMAASMPVVIASDQSSLPVTLGAGTALAGKVGIDQVTAGANNVQITDVNSNELLNIPLASGTGGSAGAYGPFHGLIGVVRVATKTVTSAGATTTSIPSTAHGAAVGNIIQIISGAQSPTWSYVSAVPDANTITLGFPLPVAPANGVSFIIHQQTPLSAVGGQASTDNGSALIVAHGTLGGAITGSSFGLKLEDSAHMGDGGAGFGIMSRQEAVPTNGVGTDGDCQWLKGSVYGETWTQRGGASFTRIVTATTTTVKSGVGILHRIIVNSAVASASLTIYDNTAGSGTLIGIVTEPATLLQNHYVLEFGLRFGTGLTIVTVGTDDFTVVYS